MIGSQALALEAHPAPIALKKLVKPSSPTLPPVPMPMSKVAHHRWSWCNNPPCFIICCYSRRKWNVQTDLIFFKFNWLIEPQYSIHSFKMLTDKLHIIVIYVIDIAWKGVLYGLYSHEPEGQSFKGKWLYKPYSTNLPCYMCYISVLSCRARAKM